MLQMEQEPITNADLSTQNAEDLATISVPNTATNNTVVDNLISPNAGNSPRTEKQVGTIVPLNADSIFNGATKQEESSEGRSRNDRRDLPADLDTSTTDESKGSLKEAKATFGKESAMFRNLQLQDENGLVPVDGMEKARDQIDRMKADQLRRAAEVGKPAGPPIAGIDPQDWVWQGPGNIGGRMRSIVIHPTDPNKMWIGSVGGGIWKTTNAGTLWSPVNDFMANLAVSTMVIDPTNPNIMYAGTGEYLFGSNENPITGLQGARGDGVFKSIDGGVTWNQLAQTKVTDPAVCPVGTPCPWMFVNRLAISPDGTTILAGTVSGVHRSTNGGATWTRVTASLTRIYFDIDFHPTNSQLAIAGADNITIYSTDGGQTWLNGGFSPGIGPSVRVEMAYAPSSPNIVYASVGQGTGDVYQSTDGGQTFTIVNTGTNLLAGQGIYTNIIWVNPMDPAFVIVGGIDLWRSTDSGANFTAMSRWQSAPANSAHADHHMIVAHPGFNNTTNKTVYFGNDGGIYRTNDVSTATTTTGWTNLNNSLGITQFYGAAANSAGVIVGGTQDNGSLRSNANINGWTTTVGGDGGFVAADPTDTNYFYTEYISLGIQRSSNGGMSASYIYCNPAPATGNGGPCMAPAVGITDAFNGANFIAPFILDPNEPNRMLAGGLSLWRSNDIKAAGLPTWADMKPSIGSPISAISVATGNSDFIVVGHNNGQIFLSQNGTDGAPTWTQIDTAALPNRFVTRFAIDETRITPWIYATFGGFSPDNIWRTENLGATWTDVTGSGVSGLPDVPVRSIVVNPARQNQLFVGTEIGIFASDDGGASWQLPQDGPANVSVDELFWRAGMLYAATHGRGIYRSNGGGGGGGIGYATPSCAPASSNCSCGAREWFCHCAWPSGFPPDTNADVYVGCPMTVNANGTFGSIQVRNLTLGGGITLYNNPTITTTEDFANHGVISSALTPNSGTILARNFFNSGIISVNTVDVTGNIANGGTLSVAGLLEASKNVLSGEGSHIGAGRIYAGGDFLSYSSSPLTLTTDLSFGGNLHNQGRIQGRLLSFAPHFSGTAVPRTISGPGVLKFSNTGFGGAVTILNDKFYEVETFHVGGTVNLGNNSLDFTDNVQFTGDGLFTGNGSIRLTPRTGVNATFSYNNGNVTPSTLRFVSGTYHLTGANGAFGGPLIINPGAILAANSAGMTVNNNVTIDGTLTTTGTSFGTSSFFFAGSNMINNGVISNNADQNFVFYFYGSSPTFPQTISGTGTWAPRTMQFGNNAIAQNVNLANDITFTGQNLQLTSSGTLGGTLNLGGNTLTHTGTTFFSSATAVNNGTLKIQPAGGTYTLNAGTSTAGLRIASGTATAAANIFTGGPLTVDSGATLAIGGSFVGSNGNVTIDGTLTGPVNSSFLARGNNTTFINNGNILTGVTFAPPLSTPITQNVGGTGIWGGANTRFFVGRFSTVNLLNDITYGGTNVFLEGPGVRLNTGSFTFSVPCSVVWQSTGEVSGNVRQTNLAACPGATLTFGNPFTSIRFTSGMPPTDIRVETLTWAPVGFINAVRRHYLITPTGGSGYAATLRLRYLDSELNGNSESTLQLWRDDGSAWTAQGASSRNSTDNWVEYSGVTQFSPWAISSALVPTSSDSAVSGRIVTADGRGIRGVKVSLSDQNGSVRTALTSSLGYYRFENILSGQTVVLNITSKQYTFANPTRIVTVGGDIADVDFTAEP